MSKKLYRTTWAGWLSFLFFVFFESLIIMCCKVLLFLWITLTLSKLFAVVQFADFPFAVSRQLFAVSTFHGADPVTIRKRHIYSLEFVKYLCNFSQLGVLGLPEHLNFHSARWQLTSNRCAANSPGGSSAIRANETSLKMRRRASVQSDCRPSSNKWDLKVSRAAGWVPSAKRKTERKRATWERVAKNHLISSV